MRQKNKDGKITITSVGSIRGCINIEILRSKIRWDTLPFLLKKMALSSFSLDEVLSNRRRALPCSRRYKDKLL